MSVGRLMAMAAGGLAIAFAAVPVYPLHAQANTSAIKAKTSNAKQTKTNDVRADSRFIRELASDNLLEAKLGQLAEKKAANAAVKQFAERMVTDHTKLEDQLSAMASQNGMAIKPRLGPRHQEKVDRLDKLSGKDFDRAYMTLMVQNHKDDVDYLQNEGRSAHSAPVRDLAASALPILQEHLTLAKQTGAQVGADTTTVTHTRHAAAKKK